MKKYEIMFIVRPTLQGEEITAVSKKFEKVLTDNGATIANVKSMGQRELAYEIKDFKTGFYFVFNVEAKDSAATTEFDRQAKNSPDIIRHLITKEEE